MGSPLRVTWIFSGSSPSASFFSSDLAPATWRLGTPAAEGLGGGGGAAAGAGATPNTSPKGFHSAAPENQAKSVASS